MTSTNDGKDVKIVETSGAKGKIYYIELYKNLECRLTEEQELPSRTACLKAAWQQIHTLCLHSAPNTHPHLLSWLQRHTAKTILQTEWQSPKSKPIHTILEDGINNFIAESEAAVATRNGRCLPWEAQLLQRAAWFKTMLGNPWGHPVLRMLLDPRGSNPSDDEVLEWLKEERGVLFVTRLRQLAASKCDDLALTLSSAVMDRVRACTILVPDNEQTTAQEEQRTGEPTFKDILTKEAGFTVDVWEVLTDIEFVLLHKSDKRAQCIDLAKQTPLRDGYQLVERLQSRLETSPKEKKLWKNAKEVATLIAQVIIARCMVTDSCIGVARTALYCCARSLARLVPDSKLPAAAAALAAPAHTARHVHTFASAARAQLHADSSRSAFVCELYVRAITAGMNELERLKLKTEKEAEARSHEQTLAAWFCQLGNLLHMSDRIKCECLLTAFSMHPAPDMYERIQALPKVQKYKEQAQDHQETTSEFGSWASDSRSQTNLVKTSETLNMKQTQSRNNVLSVAMLNEGERVGLGPELCQDLAVLLSGPRLKTLSWDMDREELLKNCQAYMERTSGGTRTLTTELKFLNIDPNKYQHLPEEDENVDDVYYGIEKGYEHLVEFQDPEPEEIWQDAIFSQTESSEESDSSHNTVASKSKRKPKKKTKKIAKLSSESETDPLSLADIKEAKKTETQKEKKKERPHSKERKSDKKKPQARIKNQDRSQSKEKKEPKQRKCNAERSQSKEKRKDSSQSKERKKEKRKEKKSNNNELSKLIGAIVGNEERKKLSPTAMSIKQRPLSRQNSDLHNFINIEIKTPLPEPSPASSYSATGFNQAFLAHIQKTVSPAVFKKQTKSKPSSPVQQRKVKTMQTKVRNIVGKLQQNTRPATPKTKKQSKANVVPPLQSPKVETQIPSVSSNIKEQLAISDDVKKSITNLIKFRKTKTGSTSLDQAAPSSSASVSDGSTPIDSLNPINTSKKTDQEERMQSLREQMNFLLNFKPKTHSQPSHTNTNTQDSTSDSHSEKSYISSPSGLTIQPKTKVNALLNQQNIKYPSRNRTQPQIKKDMNAQAQIEELFRNVQRNFNQTKAATIEKVIPKTATSNTSQISQPSKQASQTKKTDIAPTTFARLSYLHKNKQEQAKINVLEATPSTSTPADDHSTSELDNLISVHHTLKAYHNIKSQKVNSKIRTYRKNDKVIADVCPNNVQDNQMCSSNSVAQPLKPPVEKQNKTLKASSSSNNLTMQDQAELLLLLHQQNVLNTVRRSYPETSSTQLPSQQSNATAMQPNVPNILRSNPNHVTGTLHVQAESKTPIDPNKKIVQKCPKRTVPPISIPTRNKDQSKSQALASEPIPVFNFPVNETPIIRSMLNSPSVTEKNGHSKCIVEPKTEKSVIKQVTQVKETSEIPSSYRSKQKEKTDWESVMNLLLAQKTPKRGPNALDITLNKAVYNENKELKVVNTETTSPQVPVMTATAQSRVIKSSVSQHNKVLPMTPPITKKVEQKPVKVEPKLVTNKAAPSFSKHLSKGDDPFMSGIPNSDYDLLEELMDDELRKEIGELSSDDDTFTPRTSLNRNVTKSKDQKCKAPSVERKSITTPVLCTQQLDDKKHIVDTTQFMKPGHVQTPIMSTPFTKTNDAVHRSPNVNVGFVRPQEKPEIPQNVSIISPMVANIPGPVNAANYILTQQQPQLQNMFLIGGDVVYDPFTSVQIQNTSIASNTVLAVNSAPIGFYRATQVVAPIVNPVVVQSCITLQQGNSATQSNLNTTENSANTHNRHSSNDFLTTRNQVTSLNLSQNIKHSESKAEFFQNNNAECKPKNTAHNIEPNLHIQSQNIIKKQNQETRNQVTSLNLSQNIKHSESKAEFFQNNAECKPKNTAHNIESNLHIQSQNIIKKQKESQIKLLAKRIQNDSLTHLGLGERSNLLQMSLSQGKHQRLANHSQDKKESKQTTPRRKMHSKLEKIETQQRVAKLCDKRNESSAQIDSKRHNLEKALKSQCEPVQKSVRTCSQDKHVASQTISKNKIRPKKQYSENVQKPLTQTKQLSEEIIINSKKCDNKASEIQTIEKQTKSYGHTVPQAVPSPSQDNHEPNQTSTKANLQNTDKQQKSTKQNSHINKHKVNKNKKRVKSRKDNIVYCLPSQHKKVEPEFQRRTRSFSVPAKNEQSLSGSVTEAQSEPAGIQDSHIQENEESNTPTSYTEKKVDDRSIKPIHIDLKKMQHDKINDALDSSEVKNKKLVPEVTKLIDVKSNLDSILQKQLERKVLSEVQEKLSSSAEIMETKFVDTKNLERIKKKRNAIIHRQITHQSYYPSIPLTYSPITIIKKPSTPHTIDSINAISNEEQDLSVETKDIPNENKEGVEYAMTPDSQDDVENKSMEIAVDDNIDSKPHCRRILLRSSNKHIDVEKSTAQLKQRRNKKVKSDIKFDSKVETSSISKNRRSNQSKRASIRIQTKVAADKAETIVGSAKETVVDFAETIVDSATETIIDSLDDAHTVLDSLAKKSVSVTSNCTKDLLQNTLTNVEECSQNSGHDVSAQLKPCLIVSDEPSLNSGQINNVTCEQATTSEQPLVEKGLIKNLHDDLNCLTADSIVSKDRAQNSSIVKNLNNSESVNNKAIGTKKKYGQDSGNLSKPSVRDTTCQDKAAQLKDRHIILAKERMSADVIEKYRNFILIKEIPSPNPNVRYARIQLPNKKAFKVTITGGKTISYDSILENPQIRDYLLNSIDEDTRQYTINVQKGLRNQVFTSTLQPAVNTMETIDLLSDEEENNSKTMRTFKTEYGIYSVSNDVDDTTYNKHQLKFLQKCSITLHDCSPKEQIITEPVINFRQTGEFLNYEELVLSSDTDTDFVAKTQSKPTYFTNKDVIEIDDSSTDEDLRQFVLPIEIALSDLNVKSRQGPETRSQEYNNKIAEPTVGDIVELKNKLLEDLDISPLDIEEQQPFDINISKDINISSKMTTLMSGIITNIKPSVETKQICEEVIMRQCFVKLIRCDDRTEIQEIHEQDQDPTNTELLLSNSDTEDACSVVSSRRGSFSILNEFPVSLTDNIDNELNHCLPHNICNVFDSGRSSPVMEIYEFLTTFVSSQPSDGLNQTTLPLMCDSDYLKTKPHNSLFHKQQSNTKNFCDDSNQCFLRYTKVSSLLSLVMHFLNNSEQVKYSTHMSSNLKRKLIAKPGYAFTMKRSRKGLAPGLSNQKLGNNSFSQSNLTHTLRKLEMSNKANAFSPTLAEEDSCEGLKYAKSLDSNEEDNRENRVKGDDKQHIVKNNVQYIVNVLDQKIETEFSTIKFDDSQVAEPDRSENKELNETILTHSTKIVCQSCGSENLHNSDKYKAIVTKMQESCLDCEHELLESDIMTEIKQLPDCETTDTSIIRNNLNCDQNSLFAKAVMIFTNEPAFVDLKEETNIAQSSSRHIFSNDNIDLEISFVDEHSDAEYSEVDRISEAVIKDNYKPVKSLKDLAQCVLDNTSNSIKLDVSSEAENSNEATEIRHIDHKCLETITDNSNPANIFKELGQEVHQNRKSIEFEITFEEHSDAENSEVMDPVPEAVMKDNYKPVKSLRDLAQCVLDNTSNSIKLDVSSEAENSNQATEIRHIDHKCLETITDNSNPSNIFKELGQEVHQNRKSIEFEITFEDDDLNISEIDDLIHNNDDSIHESESRAAKDSKSLAQGVLNRKKNKIELEVTDQEDKTNVTSEILDNAENTIVKESNPEEKQFKQDTLNHNRNIELEVTIEDDNSDSDECKIINSEAEIIEKEIHSSQVECLKDLAQKALDRNSHKLSEHSSSSQTCDKSAEDSKQSNYDQIINYLKSITSSHLLSSCGKPQQKMSVIYKDSNVVFNGALHEDPEIGTCYLFTYIENENNRIDAELLKATRDGLFEVVQEIDMDDDIIADVEIPEETLDTDLLVLIPKNTYTKRSVGSSSEVGQKNRKPLKRKLEMCETKTSKTKYRKGKNIDFPKIRAEASRGFAYEKEFKRLLDYITSVDFSYDFSFHKDYSNDNLHLNWPIKGICETQDSTPEPIDCIFDDNNLREVVDPLNLSLMDEINGKYDEEEHRSCYETEIHLNMGFGEGSGRVLHNSENGGSLQKISAATLSDVKHSQPFLLFEDYEDVDCQKITSSKQDHLEKLKQYIKYIHLRDKVRTFFRNTAFELNEVRKDMKTYKKTNTNKERHLKCNLISELCKPDFIKPLPMETLVNVVQVGQLPVSTAAQNPVTCDPRVTQVSDASPSQCSVENSPRDDSQSGMKTEYTELTTADLSMPLMQNYTQHSQESEDASSLLPPDNTPIKAEIKEEDDTNANSSDIPELLDLSTTMKKDDMKTLENDVSQDLCPNQINNIDYSFDVNSALDNSESDGQMLFKSTEKESTEVSTDSKNVNGSSDKTDQLAHAMNAAGITTTPESISNNRAHALVNLLSQKILQSNAATGQASANNFTKTTAINAMSLQQALAQILPPALNQASENQTNQNTSVGPQVLHFVQSKNGSGNQLTLLDNSQQSVINNPNSTSVLHIVQNKTSSPGVSNSGGTNIPQTNTFSGLSLVDAGIQQGGNQLLHIVNTGNQKNGNTGQVIKRVNLLTNLTNAQGSNEQKMVQFVCKSADGKPLQLNGPHHRSMVLRLQPIETPAVQSAQAKATEGQEHSPSVNVASSSPGNDPNSQQEIKSRSIYEENYAKFIQNSSTKPTTGSEKSTSLPKFNQAFGKAVYQDGNQKPEDLNTNANSLPSLSNNNTDTNNAPASEGSMNMDQMNQMNNAPSMLQQKPAVQTSQPQANLVQQIKQTLGPMNIQTMHGGVIYTRQIPVNIGGGQTINLITVPSTELMDDPNQKNHNEMEPSIIKIVPQTGEGQADDLNNQGRTGENAQNMQPQPVLTQMRIKLPMLSKAPHMVSGTRVVRPSFFQIQRNVIGGTNQPVYQQLVLTTAPPLGQQTIRLPTQTQTQTRPTKLPSESQSSSESQMSTSTLEQLREFDMVLEQVKERSTVQPNGNSTSTNSFSGKIHTSSTDTTDGPGSVSSNTADTHSVLYSIGVNQTANVAYLTRKAPVSTPITSTFVRSPDSSGIADSPTSSTLNQMSHANSIQNETSNEASHHKSKVSSKSKSRPKTSSNPPTAMKIHNVPPKPSSQKPLEDEQTTQRILYILAEYKEQVENSPDKDKPAPRRRSNPPANPPGSSKRKKSSSGSRRSGGRDMSPVHGDDTSRTMGSEDSSCGTSQGDCTENCLDSHSPQDSPRKVARKLTFDQDNPPTPSTTPQPQPPQPQRNVIVADGQTITVARGTAGKPATAVLMPANYILPVSMVKGGQQIAIVTNRGPKLLTVGGGEPGTTNALLLQRLIGPAGLKPVLARPGVRHVRLPTAALHNLHAFNLASATTVQPPDSTASSATGAQEVTENRIPNSPWTEAQDSKLERGSSPDGSEPWHLPSSADNNEYNYEDVRADHLDRTVLDAIPDRYSPDMEAQRIFDKMFDTDSKKSYIVDSHEDSPRCGYDIDASDDDKAYQVVHKKYGAQQHRRLTHVSAAALRHKYAILEQELRLQKSLSEECEDLGVDSPSASELFPEAELLFAASPAQDHGSEGVHRSHSPPPPQITTIPQPDIDDQIATDQLLQRDHLDDRTELDVNLGLDVDGEIQTPLDHEEFARSHPNTTFHSEPTDDEVVQPFTITELKARHITSAIFHSNRAPATVLMTAPQTTVISQATADGSSLQNPVKYSDIDNMINSLPGPHTNTINLSSVLVKDDGLTRFDSILTDSRELHLTNTASAIVHATGNATQVIRRVCYDEKRAREHFLMDEPGVLMGEDAKMVGEDNSTDAPLGPMVDVDDDRSSPERHTELFWESNSASERSESRRPLDFSSDSDKCCKSPSLDETNSTDSSGIGTHMRLDSVIKEARGVERSCSAEGSSADDTHPPLRTYPAAKRMYHTESDVERSLSGKTREGERSPDSLEVRRRASGRGVVKRGCHCCNGSPAPSRPKKSRPRKPNMEFN